MDICEVEVYQADNIAFSPPGKLAKVVRSLKSQEEYHRHFGSLWILLVLMIA